MYATQSHEYKNIQEPQSPEPIEIFSAPEHWLKNQLISPGRRGRSDAPLSPQWERALCRARVWGACRMRFFFLDHYRHQCSNRLIFHTFWLVICKMMRIRIRFRIQLITLLRIRILIFIWCGSEFLPDADQDADPGYQNYRHRDN